MNRRGGKYFSDPRYARVYEDMELLGIMDISTTRQSKNGTIVWKLPIKNEWPRNKNGKGYKCIEVASFKTGYVRNQNSGYSNYQLNKRYFVDEYYKDYEWVTKNDGNGDYGKQEWNGKYRRYKSKSCKLIPIEIDRLEYLISYCLKNYYIKHANFVANGEYIPKWRYDNLADAARLDYETKDYSVKLEEKLYDLQNKLDRIKTFLKHEVI